MSTQFSAAGSTQPLVVPTTQNTTTIGAPFALQVPWDALVLVSTLVSLAASTLDIYIQESWDGATWDDVAHFTQIAGGAPTITTRVAVARPSGAGTVRTVGTGGTPALAAGTLCEGPWSTLLRLVGVSGAGVNGAQVTETIRFVPWQQST